MINWQSILSSFNDKPTLLEWLKKVQKALNESVLKTVAVSQKKTGKVNAITLFFNFEDGTSIQAPAFTVRDGDDANLELLTALQSVVGDFTDITYDTTDGLTLVSQGELTYNGKKSSVTFTTRIPVIGSANISVDLDEANQKLVFSIDKSNNIILNKAGTILGVGNDNYYLGFSLSNKLNPHIIQRANVAGTPIVSTYLLPIVGNVTATMLTSENVKTLFGNQSIVGNGNIDLYRHHIQCQQGSAVGYGHIDIDIISSKNLKVDSLTDLKSVLGNTFRYPAFGQGDGNSYMVLGVNQNGPLGYPIEGVVIETQHSWTGWTFTDTVTTI